MESALSSLTPELLATFRKIHAGLGSAPALKVLSAHQDAIVTAMAELIIPATDTPGAKEVRVNEFIDHIVAEWYSDEERDRFLAGIADVDARTQALFQRNFVDASPFQQSEVLRGLGEEMAEAVDALSAVVPGHRSSSPEPQDNFYLMFRQLTLTGYFTSEAGFTRQLHEEIIPGRFDGCAPVSPATETQGS